MNRGGRLWRLAKGCSESYKSKAGVKLKEVSSRNSENRIRTYENAQIGDKNHALTTQKRLTTTINLPAKTVFSRGGKNDDSSKWLFCEKSAW